MNHILRVLCWQGVSHAGIHILTNRDSVVWHVISSFTPFPVILVVWRIDLSLAETHHARMPPCSNSFPNLPCPVGGCQPNTCFQSLFQCTMHRLPGSGHEKIFWKLRVLYFQLFYEQCWKMPKSMLRLGDNTADPYYQLFKKMDSLPTLTLHSCFKDPLTWGKHDLKLNLQTRWKARCFSHEGTTLRSDRRLPGFRQSLTCPMERTSSAPSGKNGERQGCSDSDICWHCK